MIKLKITKRSKSTSPSPQKQKDKEGHLKHPKYMQKRFKYMKSLTKRATHAKMEDIELLVSEDGLSFSIKNSGTDGSVTTHT